MFKNSYLEKWVNEMKTLTNPENVVKTRVYLVFFKRRRVEGVMPGKFSAV